MKGLNHINYLYDAAGNKLRRLTMEDWTIVHTTDYPGNIVYVDDEIQYILTDEGRVVFNPGGSHEYQYSLKDHLGNTRVTINENGTIIQEDSYYPFGMTMAGLKYQTGLDLPNKYLYNGKELHDDFGLEWYDYGARFYDAQLGRFPSIDPIIEKFPYLTPFNYASNNPVTNIDLWGLQGISPNGGLHEAVMSGALTQDEFQKLNKELVKMSKYPIMVGAMCTGNPIALILMPTSLGLNIVKDVLSNNKEAQDSPNNLTGVLGKAADEVSEKVTGEESDIFEEVGELLETVATAKGLLKSPKNLNEVVDKSQNVMDVITESGDVIQEVLQEGQNKNNEQNSESSEIIHKEKKK